MTVPAPTSPDSSAPPTRPLPMALVTWAFIGLILILVVALVVVKLTQGSTPVSATPAPAAPGGVVSALQGLSSADYAAAAEAPPGPGPSTLAGQPVLEVGGKPAVVFVGAEFSPYSAAVSWPVVAALSRFGTFSRLGAASSSPQEVFPRTPGLSFARATYRSPYLTLSAMEHYGASLSTVAPAGYPDLAAPSQWVEGLVRRYAGDQAPLPFVDVAGRMVAVGSNIGFSPGLLQGQSPSQVVASLGATDGSEGQAVLGVANELSAAICSADGQRPSSVCSDAGVRAAAGRVGLN